MRARTLITTGLAATAGLGLAGSALAAPQVTGVEATKAGKKKVDVDVATLRGASAVAPRIAVSVQRRIAWARYTDWDPVLTPTDTVHSIARMKGVRAQVGSTLSVRVRACDTTCATTTHSVTVGKATGVSPLAPLPPGSVSAAGAVAAAIARVGADSTLILVKRSYDPVAAWKVVLRRTDGARVRVLSSDLFGSARALKEAVAEWTPERAATVTGVPAERIGQLARAYATTAPAALRINYGLQRHYGGGMAVRAITCLPALIGAWKHRGGGIQLSTSGSFRHFDYSGLHRPDLLAGRTPRTLNMNRLGDALSLDPAHKAFPCCLLW
jgi:hypothetical protein